MPVSDHKFYKFTLSDFCRTSEDILSILPPVQTSATICFWGIKEAWCRSASAFQCMMNLNIPPQHHKILSKVEKMWMFSVQRKRKNTSGVQQRFDISWLYQYNSKKTDMVDLKMNRWKRRFRFFLVSPSLFKWKMVVFGGVLPWKLTYLLKIQGWKMIHVSFPFKKPSLFEASTLISFSGEYMSVSKNRGILKTPQKDHFL